MDSFYHDKSCKLLQVSSTNLVNKGQEVKLLVNGSFSRPPTEVRAKFLARFATEYPMIDRMGFIADDGQIYWTMTSDVQASVGSSLRLPPAVVIRVDQQFNEDCFAQCVVASLEVAQNMPLPQNVKSKVDSLLSQPNFLRELTTKIYRKWVFDSKNQILKMLNEAGLDARFGNDIHDAEQHVQKPNGIVVLGMLRPSHHASLLISYAEISGGRKRYLVIDSDVGGITFIPTDAEPILDYASTPPILITIPVQ